MAIWRAYIIVLLLNPSIILRVIGDVFMNLSKVITYGIFQKIKFILYCLCMIFITIFLLKHKIWFCQNYYTILRNASAQSSDCHLIKKKRSFPILKIFYYSWGFSEGLLPLETDNHNFAHLIHKKNIFLLS